MPLPGLKIWQKDASETIVYDNQLGDGDNADASQGILGGSIVIHKTGLPKGYSDDKLFTYSIGGMRPFAELAQEMMDIAAPGIHGMITGEWIQLNEMKQFADREKPKTKEEILEIKIAYVLKARQERRYLNLEVTL